MIPKPLWPEPWPVCALKADKGKKNHQKVGGGSHKWEPPPEFL